MMEAKRAEMKEGAKDKSTAESSRMGKISKKKMAETPTAIGQGMAAASKEAKRLFHKESAEIRGNGNYGNGRRKKGHQRR